MKSVEPGRVGKFPVARSMQKETSMQALRNNTARSRKAKGVMRVAAALLGAAILCQPDLVYAAPHGGGGDFHGVGGSSGGGFHGAGPGGFHTPITLKVEAVAGLPGLTHSALCRFLAAQMADARRADWRFQPAEGDIAAPNRVEWTFRMKPYAGGEVRQFVRESVREQGFGVHRPATVEVRLYLDGEFQALVERQAMIQGGPNDPELAAAVASATESLLGPSGAYRTNYAIGRQAQPT
jgi:hypothetical protein